MQTNVFDIQNLCVHIHCSTLQLQLRGKKKPVKNELTHFQPALRYSFDDSLYCYAYMRFSLKRDKGDASFN